MATPMGFEPTISTVTGWHVNRYTTGPRLFKSIINSSWQRVRRSTEYVGAKAARHYNALDDCKRDALTCRESTARPSLGVARVVASLRPNPLSRHSRPAAVPPSSKIPLRSSRARLRRRLLLACPQRHPRARSPRSMFPGIMGMFAERSAGARSWRASSL